MIRFLIKQLQRNGFRSTLAITTCLLLAAGLHGLHAEDTEQPNSTQPPERQDDGPRPLQNWGRLNQHEKLNFPEQLPPAACLKKEYDREAAAECRRALRKIARSRNARDRFDYLEERCGSGILNFRRYCYALGVIRETQGDSRAAKRLIRRSCDETVVSESDRYANGCRDMSRYYWTPLNLGLIWPLQFFSEHYAVNGLSVSFIAAWNDTVRGAQISMLNVSDDLWGFQIGLIANRTEVGYGLQFSAINVAEVRFGGIQIGLLGNFAQQSAYGFQISGLMNFTGENFYGIQIGGSNFAERPYGIQAGVINFGLNMKGAQLGLLNASASLDGTALGLVNIGSRTRGIRAGIVNYSRREDSRSIGTMTGLSVGLINHDHAAMHGISLGGYNYARDMRGIQIGAFNRSQTMSGLSVGLVNYTEKANGVQIGLVNIIRQGPLPIMLLVNADFADLSPDEYAERQARAF